MTDPRLEPVCRAICAEEGQDPDERAILTTIPASDDLNRSKSGREPGERGPRWRKYEPRARLFLAQLDAATKGERS